MATFLASPTPVYGIAAEQGEVLPAGREVVVIDPSAWTGGRLIASVLDVESDRIVGAVRADLKVRTA